MENSDQKLIVISGPSGAGKTTIAKEIEAMTGAKIISVRSHYKNYLVPAYLKANGLQPNGFSKEITIQAADWIYKEDPAGYAKQLLKDAPINRNTIIESLRIKDDLEYLEELHPDMKIIYIYADKMTRIRRKIISGDEFVKGKTEQEVRDMIEYEWEHYDQESTKEFIRGNGSLIIDTSGFYGGSLPPDLIPRIKAFLEKKNY